MVFYIIPFLRGILVTTVEASNNLDSSLDHHSGSVGVVVIGRNEGERLKRCLASVLVPARPVVYVDSGSSDGSVAYANGIGVDVVELDMRIPFTAARARNAGFERLQKLASSPQFVQFVDGDCELHQDWIHDASQFLLQHPEVSVVAGRLKERFPDASVYNMLCDMEWEAPVGEAKVCGGIAMMRAAEFGVVNGFNVALICGEEPELCSRLRARGGKVWRMANDMAWHDANMMRFGQWWMRAVRTGYSFAQATYVDSNARGRQESLSALFWAFVLPAVFLTALYLFGGWGVLILLVYAMQFLRIITRSNRATSRSSVRAFFLILGKFPELQGQIKYRFERFVGWQSVLIEHK